MTRSSACLLCVSLSLAGISPMATADEAKKEAIQEDRKRIEGRWRVAELVVNGNVAQEEDARKLMVVNDADGTWKLFSEGKQVSKGLSTIDPTKAPKTIDFSPTEGCDWTRWHRHQWAASRAVESRVPCAGAASEDVACRRSTEGHGNAH
jgi:uncharacterized protein (TIGR03067 family)